MVKLRHPVTILYCSCTKAASSGIRARFTFQYQVFKISIGKFYYVPKTLLSGTSGKSIDNGFP